MKHRLITALLFMFACLLALTACGRSEVALETFVVTFRDDDGRVMLAYDVPAGQTPGRVPDRQGIWEDDSGAVVEPREVCVVADTDFTLCKDPEANPLPGPLLAGVEGCFAPDGTLTRAEAAETAAALLLNGDEQPRRTVSFSDLSPADEAWNAVQLAASYHLLEGYSDGSFRPEAAVTRAEFISLLWRISGLEGAEPAFPDVPEGHWAAAAIGSAAEQGWVTGYPDGRFYPEAPVTRAEAAAILRRYLGCRLQSEEIAGALAGQWIWRDVPEGHWAFEDITEISWRNDLLRCLLGETEAVPGFTELDGQLCHIAEEDAQPEYFEAGFHVIEDGLWHVSRDGYGIDRLEPGLYEMEDGMYCVEEADGPFLTEAYSGYLWFGEDGRYTSGSEIVDAAVEELLEGIIGNDEMTKDEKLYAGFLRVRDGGFFYRSVNDTGWGRGTTGWSLWAAERMFTQHYGTCYYWAAAFLYVARRLGFQAYPVAGGVGSRNQLHAWVMVEFDDGEEYICDVELEWAYRNNFYGGLSNSDSMYKQPLWDTKAHYIFPGGTFTDDNGDWTGTDTSYTSYSRYSRYIQYDTGIEEGEGDFIVVPEDQQVPPDTEGGEGGAQSPEETGAAEGNTPPAEGGEPGRDVTPGENGNGDTTAPEGGNTGGENDNSGGESGNTGGESAGNTGGESGNTGGENDNSGGESGNTGGESAGNSGGESGNIGGGGNAGGNEAPAAPAEPAPAAEGDG